MSFCETRACMMTRTVTVQSWTIQALQSPAKLQATGENLTPQPTQKKQTKKNHPSSDPAFECLSEGHVNAKIPDQAH